MAGELDRETERENRRLAIGSPAVDSEKVLETAARKVITEEFAAAGASIPRGGLVTPESRAAFVEQRVAARATPAEKKAIKAAQNINWATSFPKVQQETLSDAARVAGVKGLPWSKSYAKYPGIALAAAKAVNAGSLDRKQLETVSAAVEIIDNAQQLLMANSDITRQNILNRLPKPKQDAVLQASFLLGAEWEALQAATVSNTGAESPIMKGLSAVGGAVINGLIWASEQGQRFGRAWTYAWTEGTDPIEGWIKTGRGGFDEEAVNALRSEFGDVATNVVKDVVFAQQNPDEFSWGELLEKYGNDEAALAVIDAVILEKERVNFPGMDDLLGRMNAARLDNLGGAVANAALPEGMEGTSPVWTGVSKGTNIATLLTLDPTLAVGKAYRGYNAMRYGLVRNFGANTLEDAFTRKPVVKFFSSVADDIDRYNNAKDAAAAGKIAGEMRVKYGKYLTDDAIESLAKYAQVEGKRGIKDTKALVQNWLNDMDGLQLLMRGQSARRPMDRLAPRMTVAQQARIKARLAGREFISFDGKMDSTINAVIGADLDAADRQALKALGLDPRKVSAEQVSDLIQSPSVQQFLANSFGLEPKSWARRIITMQPSQRSVRQQWDKLFRKFEYIPRGLEVKIADASDARKIYQISRTTFSKSFSETVSESWKYLEPGERRLMLNGLFDTIAQARGINLDQVLDDGVTTLRDRIMTSGSKGAEQYAATVGGFEAVPFGTPIAQYSQRLTRAALPKLDTAARDRVNAINAKLAQFFERQTSLQMQIDMLKGDIDARTAALGVLNSTDQEIDDLVNQLESIVKSIKDQKGREWGAGQALLKERKALKANPSAFQYNPADFAGKQHALHLFQMSDSVRIPNFADLQRYQQRRGVLDKILGGVLHGELSTKAVDVWSATNLVSPRYVMRNATEDWIGYILSGGSFDSAMKGRLMSTMYREVRGRKLGMVEERTRLAADSNAALGRLFLDHMPEDDVRMFLEAIKNGDAEIADGIAGTAFARIQATALGRKLNTLDEDFFRTFATTPSASRLVDHIAEIRGDLNSGRLVSAIDSTVAPQMRRDLGDLRNAVEFEYRNIPFDQDTDAYILWHEMLSNILHRDGKAGQIVFNAMRYADTYKGGVVSSGWERYKQKLVDFFSDREAAADWWAQSSALQQFGPEEFARRYFDAASNYFSHAGIVNGDLVKSITRTSPDGAKFGALYLKEGDKISDATRFSIDNLRKYGRFDRPEFILGKAEKTVGGTDNVQLIDTAFGYLGESLARISREPIFFANALDEWKAVQPQISAMVKNGVDEAAAKKIAMEGVLDRAEQLTLAYMDNPNVRTQLAFNARNVARYYRATEDFYRRALRLATYRPEQIQKLNLVYQNMNNSGMMWEDDQGTQYFIYPGTGVVNESIAKAMRLFGYEPSITNPFVFGGQTMMLTPSSDPASLLPTFASPVIAAPTKILTAIGPFKWLEPVFLGSRGTQPTENLGDLGQEILRATLPGPILRLMSAMPTGERDTAFSSATIAAMRYADYAGVFKQKESETDEAFKARVKSEVGNIAMATLGLRFIFGFLAPASPQLLTEDDLTSAARSLGLKNLRSGYTQLLNKYKGDYDRATAEWFKLNPDLMPYTVSTTEARGQGYPSLTTESGKWLVRNADFITQHPAAAPFLTPDEGDFSFSTYGMAKSLRMIQGKTVDQAWLEIATAKDYYKYMETKSDADAAIAAEPSSYMRNVYRQQWAELKKQMFAENPYLETRVGTIKEQSNVALKKSALQDMRAALSEIYSDRRGLKSDRTDKLTQMINTFDDGMAAVEKFGGSTTYAEDMREYTRSQLRSILEQAAGDDRGAQDFYRRVLDPLIGG